MTTAETTQTTEAPLNLETEFELLKPSAIAPHKKNPRKALGDIGELADSMKGGAGVIEPLIVTPSKAKDKYTLIAGHRRLAAAKKAGLKLVPCIVRYDLEGDDRAQLEVMLTENLHRVDFNVVEEGDAYQTLLEFDDVDIKSLAARTGHKPTTIRGRIKLAQAPEPLQQKLIAKQVTIEDALALVEFANDQTVYDRLALLLGSPNFQFSLQQAREDRKWERDEVKIAKDLTAQGVRIIADTDELDEEEHASDGAFEWIEFEDDTETPIPDGAERAACTVKGVPGGHIMYFKRAVEKDETGAPIKPKPEPKEETPAQIAAREAKERDAKLTDDLATAATVRRRHLASVAAEHDEDLALKCLRGDVLDAVSRGNAYGHRAMFEMLGVPPFTKDDDENDLAEVERHVNKMSLEQLAVSTFLLRRASVEKQLETPYQWQRTETISAFAQWHEDLTEMFGYEYSDVELELLAAQQKAIRAEKAAGDESTE